MDHAGLPEEAVLGFPSAKLIDIPFAPGAQRTTTVPNARGGRWAVALVNHGRPALCTDHCPVPGGATEIITSVSVRACQQDSAPTGNYGCPGYPPAGRQRPGPERRGCAGYA